MLLGGRSQHARWKAKVHRYAGLLASHNSRLLADGASAGELHHSHDNTGRRRGKGKNRAIFQLQKVQKKTWIQAYVLLLFF